jgi:transcription initiation factor TFIID subunit 2
VWNRIQKTLEAASKNAEPTPVETLPNIVVKKQVAASSKPPTISVPPPPPAGSEAPPRPMIKLKVGGSHVKAPPPDPSKKAAEVPKASQKTKQRKPKAIDEAPPPYVDDGSHDLLQEVIAIEREKDEEKRTRKTKDVPRESPPARASGSGPPGKRRKTSADDNDSEMLSLAPSLSRKEKPSAPSLSSTPAAEPFVESAPKASVSKPKKEKPSNLRDHESAAEPPRISIKGKEKEVAPSSTPTPSKPRKMQASAPLNEKKCRDILKAILRVPECIIFTQPVDPERDGCPT